MESVPDRPVSHHEPVTIQRICSKIRVAGSDPFFWAWARLAASQARTSMDKVMWAYQARQVRTWY